MLKAPEYLTGKVMVDLKNKITLLRKNCLKCNGVGYIIIDPNTGNFKDCDGCVGKIDKIERYLIAGIKNDYIDLGLVDVKSTFTQDVYKRFSELVSKIVRLSIKYNLVVYRYEDEYSYGVSTACSILLKEFIDNGYQCQIIDFVELLDSLFNFGVSEDEIKKRTELNDYLQGVPILMIDNFGSMHNNRCIPGSFGYEKLSNFINIRKMHGRFTLISSELSKKKLFNRFYGALTTLIEQYFLPFDIQCISGKHKHSAMTKLGKDNPDCVGIFPNQDPHVVEIKSKKDAVQTEDIPEDTSLDNAIKDKEGNGRIKRLSKN